MPQYIVISYDLKFFCYCLCGWVLFNKEVPQIKNNILFITLCTEVPVDTYWEILWCLAARVWCMCKCLILFVRVLDIWVCPEELAWQLPVESLPLSSSWHPWAVSLAELIGGPIPPATVVTVSAATRSSYLSVYVTEVVSVVDPWRGNSRGSSRGINLHEKRVIPESNGFSVDGSSVRGGPEVVSGDVSVAACSPLARQEKNSIEVRVELALLHEDSVTSSLREYIQRPLTSSLCCKGPLERSALCEVTHQKMFCHQNRDSFRSSLYPEWRY